MIPARDVYAQLRSALAPDLRSAGYKRLKKSQLGWFLPAGNNFVSFLVYCHPLGWLPNIGSSFKIVFQTSGEPEMTSSPLGNTRFISLLTPVEALYVLQINNDVAREVVERSRLKNMSLGISVPDSAPRTRPYAHSEDVALDYLTMDHVDTWAHFLKLRIVRMGADLQKSVT
jgi:hypothetical protein